MGEAKTLQEIFEEGDVWASWPYLPKGIMDRLCDCIGLPHYPDNSHGELSGYFAACDLILHIAGPFLEAKDLSG